MVFLTHTSVTIYRCTFLFTSGIFIFSLSMYCNCEASSGKNKLWTQVFAVKEVGRKKKSQAQVQALW